MQLNYGKSDLEKNFKVGCQKGNLKVKIFIKQFLLQKDKEIKRMRPFLKMNCLFIVPVNLFGSCPLFYEGELGISLFWLGVSQSGAAEFGVYSSSQQVPNCNVQKGKVLSKQQQSPSLVPPSDILHTVQEAAGAATLTTSKLRLLQ